MIFDLNQINYTFKGAMEDKVYKKGQIISDLLMNKSFMKKSDKPKTKTELA